MFIFSDFSQIYFVCTHVLVKSWILFFFYLKTLQMNQFLKKNHSSVELLINSCPHTGHNLWWGLTSASFLPFKGSQVKMVWSQCFNPQLRPSIQVSESAQTTSVWLRTKLELLPLYYYWKHGLCSGIWRVPSISVHCCLLSLLRGWQAADTVPLLPATKNPTPPLNVPMLASFC